MSRFIETVCVRDGKILSAEAHLKRMGRTLFDHYGSFDPAKFYPWFDLRFPTRPGRYKWRLLYDHAGVTDTKCQIYLPADIGRLKLVHADQLDYSYKFSNRQGIEKLMRGVPANTDILIVKNGYLTDSSYANILLWDGKVWWTPDTPLLRGTQRAELLKKGLISEKRIPAHSVVKYQKIRLVNAMLSFDEAPEIEIGSKTII